MNRRLIIIILVCIVTMPIIIYASANKTKIIDIPTIIESQIKTNFSTCRPLQLTDLDDGLQEYLNSTRPGLIPGYIAADFNGDGKKDYAVMLLCNEKKRPILKFVVFMANKNDSYA